MKNSSRQAEFDKFAEDYSKIQQKNLGRMGKDLSVFPRYKASLAHTLLKHSPSSILEFGCGIGNNLAQLHATFPQASIHGCDVSSKSIAIAAEREPYAQLSTINTVADIHTLYPNSMDFIFISCVLHHIPPAEHALWLQALYAALKSGGSLLIFEHNPYNPITRHMVNTCPYDADAILVHPWQCKALCKAQGFTATQLKFTLFFIWRTSFWEGIEKQISWLPLGGQYYVFAQK